MSELGILSSAKILRTFLREPKGSFFRRFLPMPIPVVFNDGREESVNEDTLQFLIATRRIVLFKRADRWAVVGRDFIRRKSEPFKGKNRRRRSIFAKAYWD
jgi:hypothetical protein